MPKNIPAAFEAHKQSGCTTKAKVVRMELKNGNIVGFTEHQFPITFDDGNGSILYTQRPGVVISNLETSSENRINTSELQTLESIVALSDIQAEDARNGLFDGAFVDIYSLNFENLSDGFETLQSGVIGNTVIRDNLVVFEVQSLHRYSKQTVGRVTSVTCPLIFGDQTPGSCGFDITTLNRPFTITEVIDDRNLRITIPGNDYSDLVPGRIRFTIGVNANANLVISQREIRQVTDNGTDAVINLHWPYFRLPSVGDQGNIRPDCNKNIADCSSYSNVPRYGGQPFINTKDQKSAVTPVFIDEAETT